jgi:hypothetical protein
LSNIHHRRPTAAGDHFAFVRSDFSFCSALNLILTLPPATCNTNQQGI